MSALSLRGRAWLAVLILLAAFWLGLITIIAGAV
jgi:hypothetical protein